MGNDISVTTDNKKYTDVIQNATDSDDVRYQKSYVFLETPGKRKRYVAFRSPDNHESQMIHKSGNLIKYAVWWKNSLKAILHLLRK